MEYYDASQTNRAMIAIPVLVLVYIHQVAAFSGGVLYPYGSDVGDMEPPNKLANRYSISFPEDIKIMGHLTSEIKVSTTGEVKYKKFLFKLFGNPYRTFDLADNSHSHMYYRMTTDVTFLGQLTQEINSVFGDSYNFSAKYAAVVTWIDVTMPGGNDYTPVNSMQAVVVADVSQTFFIINYEKINWFGATESGDSSIKAFAVMKTSDYGTKVKFTLPGAKTADLPAKLKVGNSGTPFRWIFRIDVCETCFGLPRGFCLASSHIENRTECFCHAKFRGSLCEIDVTKIDDCQSSPCKRGICIDQNDSFLCQCPAGYQGATCDIPIDPGTSGSWSTWTACSKSCDLGIRTRIRQCLAMPCLEPNTETEVCHLTPCAPYSVDEEHTTVMTASKPMLQVLQEEDTFKEAIARAVNDYCLRNTDKCCNVLSSVTPGLFQRYLDARNVVSVTGYPKLAGAGQIQIRIAVRTTVEALTTACIRDPGRTKRDSESSPDLYFTRDILASAIEDHRAVLNNETGLCCYRLFNDDSNVDEEPGYSPTFLISVILLSMIIIALSAGLIICYFKYKRPLLNKESDQFKMHYVNNSNMYGDVGKMQTLAATGMTFQGQPGIRFNPVYTSL